MINYTTTEAANQLGCARRTIQKWCKILDIKQHGRDYFITEECYKQIAERVQEKPGRPRNLSS